ncbi:MAG: hypothetical protein R3B44_13960 [Candidatus Brocadiaceae bacterium]
MLLCDEPTCALDVRTGVMVLDAIDRVNRELTPLTPGQNSRCCGGGNPRQGRDDT